MAEATVALLAAFAKTGDPSVRTDDRHHETAWPRYELNTQQYLSISECLFQRSHCHKTFFILHTAGFSIAGFGYFSHVK